MMGRYYGIKRTDENVKYRIERLYEEGYSVKYIAKKLNISEDDVMKYLNGTK